MPSFFYTILPSLFLFYQFGMNQDIQHMLHDQRIEILCTSRLVPGVLCGLKQTHISSFSIMCFIAHSNSASQTPLSRQGSNAAKITEKSHELPAGHPKEKHSFMDPAIIRVELTALSRVDIQHWQDGLCLLLLKQSFLWHSQVNSINKILCCYIE